MPKMVRNRSGIGHQVRIWFWNTPVEKKGGLEVRKGGLKVRGTDGGQKRSKGSEKKGEGSENNKEREKVTVATKKSNNNPLAKYIK